jgi:hypothetical protein
MFEAFTSATITIHSWFPLLCWSVLAIKPRYSHRRLVAGHQRNGCEQAVAERGVVSDDIDVGEGIVGVVRMCER